MNQHPGTMNNFLEEYLKQQYHQSQAPVEKEPGPIVTLSREFGCEAKATARYLAEKVNLYYRGIGETDEWEIISKEILEESAKELQTDHKKVEYIFEFEQRSLVDDFLMSMTSRHYKSDWKVRETVENVVRAFAFRGHAVIVGRAGAQITRDIKKSLHVRLVAPYEWRVQHVMEKYQTSEKLAHKKVKEMDSNRKKIVEIFSKKADCHYCYDVYYNVSTMTTDQVVSDIIHMMQLKKLI